MFSSTIGLQIITMSISLTKTKRHTAGGRKNEKRRVLREPENESLGKELTI